MWLYNVDIEVHHMNLQNSHNDGIKAMYAKSVSVHDNNIYKLGHEGLYAIKCDKVDYYNNTCRTKTNSACRLYNSNHAKIHDNKIYTEFEDDAGGPGIQIQYIREDKAQPMNDIEVYNNKIYDTYGPGIWLIANGEPYAKWEAQGVHIHDNTFTGCGTHATYNWLAGIETSGFYDTLIERNVFDGCYGAAVMADYFSPGLAPTGTGGKYQIFVRNNIIKNTRRMKQGTGGQALRNEYPETHTIVSESNYIFDNEKGPYYNVTSGQDHLYPPPEKPEEPQEPDRPAFLMLDCTEEELQDIKTLCKDKTIYRRR